MNYWPRWIGAIRKRTMHLSLAQMGAYDRLLDHYYAEEKPLPGNLEACCRIAGAVTKAERDAVSAVLAEFFTLNAAGFSNERADEEIATALPKIAASKTNGKRGGRPKKPSGFPVGTPEATQTETSPSPSPEEYKVSVLSPSLDGDVETTGFTPTPAGVVCKALRSAGVAAVNPSSPTLLALLDAGATVEEFISAAQKAEGKSHPFEYLLRIVQNERQRAKTIAPTLHHGAMPSKAPSAAELRVLQAVPGIAAPHLRKQSLFPMEVVDDVAPKRLG